MLGVGVGVMGENVRGRRAGEKIVRCRDCVRNAPSRLGDGWCLYLRRKVGAEWFCAEGEERKGHAD